MRDPTITVRIDLDTRWRLKTLMVRYGLSRSEIIREAVKGWHQREGLPERPTHEPIEGQTMIDAE